MTTTDTISRQRLTAMLVGAGLAASSESSRRGGGAWRSPGFSVTDNGEHVSICRTCKGHTYHNDGCKNPSGSSKNWHRRLVKDGTLTVTYTAMQRKSDLKAAEMTAAGERLVAFLTEAGFTVETRSADRWVVTI